MSEPTVICKHSVSCYYLRDVFFGCEKCLKRGKLIWPSQLSNNVAIVKNVLPNSPKKMDVNSNSDPFRKSSSLSRTPPPTPTVGTSTKNNDGEKDARSSHPTDMEVGQHENNKPEENADPTFLSLDEINTALTVGGNTQSLCTLINAKFRDFLNDFKREMDSIRSENNALNQQLKTRKTRDSSNACSGQTVPQINRFDVLKKSSPQEDGEGGGDVLYETDSDSDFGEINPDTRYIVVKRRRVRKKPKSSSPLSANLTKGDPPSNIPAKKKGKKQGTILTFVEKNGEPIQPKSSEKSVFRSTTELKGPAAGENTGPEESVKKQKKVKPPPIKVSEVTDFNKVKNLITGNSDVKADGYSLKLLNNNILKINPADADTHQKITNILSEANEQFVTFEDKHNRPLRVLVRGLHPSTDPQDIIADLQDKGFKIIDAVNILKVVKEKKKEKNSSPKDTAKETEEKEEEANSSPKYAAKKKIGLPLFQLTFDRSESVENVNSIKSILSCIVKIEPVKRRSGRIPQCTRCMGFQHTKSFCSRTPRCCKCSQNHLTSACPHGKFIEKPKCANCGEGHTANFRGCIVAQELQKARNKFDGKKMPQKERKDGGNLPSILKKAVNPPPFRGNAKDSYAGALGAARSSAAAASTFAAPDSTLEQINLTLALILSKLDNQQQEISWLKARVASYESAKAGNTKKGR